MHAKSITEFITMGVFYINYLPFLPVELRVSSLINIIDHKIVLRKTDLCPQIFFLPFSFLCSDPHLGLPMEALGRLQNKNKRNCFVIGGHSLQRQLKLTVLVFVDNIYGIGVVHRFL